ncbi:MAG: hypothetical protein IJT73_09725 [Selenomonadaceae bacterium]|nr:hypothetical protein [Selenomonadaceae bacterium]
MAANLTELPRFSTGRHAGFVVNAGNATAADVLNLIEEVRRRVKEVHGVTLTPEVRIIGE